MKVRCIDDGGYDCLTVGRTYVVEKETDDFYYLLGVQNETGSQQGAWFKDRFEVVESKRQQDDPFVGKTILRVNKSSVNVMKFYFTDGTGVELWSECGSGAFSIPYHEVKKFTYKLRKCGRIGKVTYTP